MNRNQYRKAQFPLLVCLVSSLVLNACAPSTSNTVQETQSVEIQTLESLPADTETPVLQPVKEQEPAADKEAPTDSIYLSPALPSGFVEATELPADIAITTEKDTAVFELDVEYAGAAVPAGQIISEWVYALAAPFPTVTDEVGLEDLKALWSDGIAIDAVFTKLLVTPNTAEVFTAFWGPPDTNHVTTASQQNIEPHVWEKSGSLALIPFDQLTPRWKVLTIDRLNPLYKDFEQESYPLTVRIGLSSSNTPAAQWAEVAYPASNRNSDQMTTLILTGVTAMVRATGVLMEREGMTYPGLDIRDWLRKADYTHINNEVPFAKRCPSAFLQEDGLVFCSKTEYIELLEDIGTDIVELSGDHFEDWGTEATLYSLELYDERGWETYGGGENLEDALKPVLIEHNGNKLALLGCNAKLPGYARASETHPGAAHCNWERMESEIWHLLQEGYLPIITFQHEEYYDYFAHPKLQVDFHRMAESGAVIVSGSQAHQAHAFEFHEGAFLHYGLGNLFFDQYLEGEPMRQAFIDRHVFYNGHHISTELLTIQFIDFARPRPMTTIERSVFLETVFSASSWE